MNVPPLVDPCIADAVRHHARRCSSIFKHSPVLRQLRYNFWEALRQDHKPYATGHPLDLGPFALPPNPVDFNAELSTPRITHAFPQQVPRWPRMPRIPSPRIIEDPPPGDWDLSMGFPQLTALSHREGVSVHVPAGWMDVKSEDEADIDRGEQADDDDQRIPTHSTPVLLDQSDPRPSGLKQKRTRNDDTTIAPPHLTAKRPKIRLSGADSGEIPLLIISPVPPRRGTPTSLAPTLTPSLPRLPPSPPPSGHDGSETDRLRSLLAIILDSRSRNLHLLKDSQWLRILPHVAPCHRCRENELPCKPSDSLTACELCEGKGKKCSRSDLLRFHFFRRSLNLDPDPAIEVVDRLLTTQDLTFNITQEDLKTYKTALAETNRGNTRSLKSPSTTSGSQPPPSAPRAAVI